MYFLGLTSKFKQLLFSLMSAVRLHQRVAFYYDVQHLDIDKRETVLSQLADLLEVFYNITLFSDFVPGFLTNRQSTSLMSAKPNFTFLNFNPQSSNQSSLLHEFIKNKYEYILISPYEIDLVAYVPFVFLRLNLNNINYLIIVAKYIHKYLDMNLELMDHNSNSSTYSQSIQTYNYLYLSLVMRDTKFLKNHLEKNVKYKSDISTINNLISILLKSKKSRKLFIDTFYKPQYIKIVMSLSFEIYGFFLISIKQLYETLYNKYIKKDK